MSNDNLGGFLGEVGELLGLRKWHLVVRSARFEGPHLPPVTKKRPREKEPTITPPNIPRSSSSPFTPIGSPRTEVITKWSSEKVIRTAIIGEYIYSTIALILGLASIIGGAILGLYGVVGHTSFTASLIGLSANFNDAAPGVVLFVVGLFMIWATRPKVKLGELIG